MLKSIFWVSRPLDVLITSLSVYVGGIISSSGYYEDYLLLAVFSAGVLAAFGNVVNDIYDINVDSRVKSFLPPPSDALSVRNATVLSMVFVSVGIIISGLINHFCLLVSSTAAFALLLYNPFIKSRAYWGNILVAFIVSLAFFYGAASVGNIDGAIIPAVFAFVFNLIREIVKDMKDVQDDQANGLRTGAVRYGNRVSRNIAVLLVFLLIILTIIPYYCGIYKIGYLITIIAGCDIFLLVFILLLFKSPQHHTYKFITGFMKLIMPLGLLAVYLGSRGL